MKTAPTAHTTREGWLKAAIDEMRPWFEKHFATIPEDVHAMCGWPKGHPRAIGQCFDPSAVVDEKSHMIWICPTQGDAVRVLDILLHELIHAAVGVKEGHKGEFRRVAKAFGLAGKMTATYAEQDSELHKELILLAERLGDYPHAVVRKPVKKVGTGKAAWPRYKSLNVDDYRVLVSAKKLAEFGAPRDPWGDEMVPVEGGDEGEE